MENAKESTTPRMTSASPQEIFLHDAKTTLQFGLTYASASTSMSDNRRTVYVRETFKGLGINPPTLIK